MSVCRSKVNRPNSLNLKKGKRVWKRSPHFTLLPPTDEQLQHKKGDVYQLFSKRLCKLN